MFGNPVQGPRIVPFGAARKVTDKLPNGHPGFRVTQRFNDPDAFFHDGRIHGALDLANYYCGDLVIAPMSGYAAWLNDANGALGVLIRDGEWSVELWHLSRRTIPSAARVSRGTIVGLVGSSGLDIGGCHIHFVVKRGTAAVDPWPLLDQNTIATHYGRINGPGINVRSSAGVPGGGLGPLFATSRADGLYRTRDGALLYRPATKNVKSRGVVRGARHGIAPYPDQWTTLWIDNAYRYVARPLTHYV